MAKITCFLYIFVLKWFWDKYLLWSNDFFLLDDNWGYETGVLETTQTSNMELFAKIVIGVKPLTIFVKSFILEI